MEFARSTDDRLVRSTIDEVLLDVRAICSSAVPCDHGSMARKPGGIRRNQSVLLVWIVSEPKPENARVRTGPDGLAVGSLLYVQRQGEAGWRAARRVEAPPGREDYDRMLWLDFSLASSPQS